MVCNYALNFNLSIILNAPSLRISTTHQNALGFLDRALFPITWWDFGILTCQVEQDPYEFIDLEAPLLIQFKSFLMHLCIVEKFCIFVFAIHSLQDFLKITPAVWR
jgi:hypothetical protein